VDPSISDGPLFFTITPTTLWSATFFVSVTARFRILYVFVALEIGSRRLVHFNVTEHPTAEWTLQQLRKALPGDHDYKFLLHDRYQTFSIHLDEEVESWGIHVSRSPVRMPTANAHCERLIGTIRRECLELQSCSRTRPQLVLLCGESEDKPRAPERPSQSLKPKGHREWHVRAAHTVRCRAPVRVPWE
jgi:transposase InsO family protein